MGRLAEMAGASVLHGPVHFVNLKGESRSFHSEAEAEAALKGVNVEHRRGGFFEVQAKTAPAPKPTGKPAAGAKPDPKAEDDKG